MQKIISKLMASLLALGLLASLIPSTIFAADTPVNGMKDGYYVYYITEDVLDLDTGKINIDGEELAEAIMNREFSGNSNWLPGSTENAKVKFVNMLPYKIEMKGFSISTPSANVISGDKDSTTGTGATGRDGHIVSLGRNPIRAGNDALGALYGKDKWSLTLMEVLLAEEKIVATYGHEGITTYPQYICKYYGVSSLDELTANQKASVFDGRVWFTTIGDMGSYLPEDEIFRYAYLSGSSYYCLETDKDLIEMGYNFCYLDSLLAFTFDNSVSNLNANTSTGLNGYELGCYLDESSIGWQEANALISNIVLEPAGSNGDTYTFENMLYAISGPLMRNCYQTREVIFAMDLSFGMEIVEIEDEETPLDNTTNPNNPENTPETVPVGNDNPQTGNSFSTSVLISLTVLCATSLVITAKKKKTKEDI